MVTDFFTFSENRCRYCGQKLPARRAVYDQPRVSKSSMQVCDACKVVQPVKEKWMPFVTGATISSVVFVKDKSKSEEETD